jgi:hypothetical protein
MEVESKLSVGLGNLRQLGCSDNSVVKAVKTLTGCLGVLHHERSPLFQTRHIPTAIRRRRVAPGIQLVFLSLTGTSGLLAVLQHGLRLAGSCNFGDRTRLLRGEIPYPLRERSSARDIKSCAGSCKHSPESNPGLSKVEVSFKRC